jgi:hypothetical protein
MKKSEEEPGPENCITVQKKIGSVAARHVDERILIFL